MEEKEIINLMQQLCMNEESIKTFVEEEISDNTEAYLASLRFVRPLREQLRYYKEDYIKQLKKIKEDINNGVIYKRSDNYYKEYQMLKNKILPKIIAEFAYENTLLAFNSVLERIFNAEGADYDLEDEGRNFPSWSLIEKDKNRNLTSRKLYKVNKFLNDDSLFDLD